MKKLSKDSFSEAQKFIDNNARDLEKARFRLYFNNGSNSEVIKELKNYQNTDGGFGHGLESDIWLPLSSPIATSVAFQIIDELTDSNEASNLIRDGIRYFEDTFNKTRNGWYTISKEVNDYPHAPWWHYDLEKKMTVIDYSWGNPTAEIIGYLYTYREFVKNIPIDKLINDAINYLNTKEEFQSEHEIYSFLRLYRQLPEEQKNRMESKLEEAVTNLVSTTPGDWEQYVPQPIKFVDKTTAPRFGILEKDLQINLDYLIDVVNTKGFISPNWQWGSYKDEWNTAKKHWAGVLTLKALFVLNKFDRLE